MPFPTRKARRERASLLRNVSDDHLQRYQGYPRIALLAEGSVASSVAAARHVVVGSAAYSLSSR